MDNLNDLKKIWLTADTTSLPDSAEIIRMAKQFRNQKLRKKILIIITALLLMAMMIGLSFLYQSKMITTRIGEACIIIAAGILAYTNVNSIGRFYRYKDYNNKEFLAFLEQTRANQIYYHQKTQVMGLAFSSVGIAFYLFETLRTNLIAGIVLYLMVGVFLLINWFYIRPKTFKKQKAKLETTIKQLEKISKQL